MRYSHFVLIGLLGCAAAQSCADVLALSNAETFSGRLVRVREGSLVFRTSLQGQMMVPMDHVQSVATEGNFVVTLADESVRYGRFVVENGMAALKPLDGTAAASVTLSTIREATPLPSSAPQEETKPPALQGWKTSGELGIQARSGKENAADAFASLETRMQQEGRLFEGDLRLERSDSDAFPRWIRGGLYWRDYGDRAWGLYAGVDAQRDVDNELSVRTGLRLGAGRIFNRFQEEDSGLLEGLFGLNFVYEEWASQEKPPDGPWRRAQDASQGDLELHLGLKYARGLRGESSLDGSLGLYPSLTEPGEWRAASEAALIVPFGEKLRLKLNILMNYDSDPGLSGVNRWNAGVGASVQLDF